MKRTLLTTTRSLAGAALLWAGLSTSGVAHAEDLLIVVPYDPVSTTVIQNDPDWVTFADRFAAYKERTGTSARVLTLEQIDAAFSGADQQERIKRAIHFDATTRGTRYVMLVGDVGVFPVRYQLLGYTTAGDSYFVRDKDTPSIWNPHPFYRFHPSDAYYSNLWHDDDPSQTFDDWNADGDLFHGEVYFDDIRGVDDISIHPDVALGRVPCADPEEMLSYFAKVMIYETRFSGSSTEHALLVSGTFAHSAGSVNTVGHMLDPTHDLSYLREDEPTGDYWYEDATGSGLAASPAGYITDVFNSGPQFVKYAGHGEPGAWSEPGFGTTDAMALTNSDEPSIATSASCSTGRFAEQHLRNTPPSAVPTDVDRLSMPEALLTRTSGGAVVYVGSVTTAKTSALRMDEMFYEAITDGLAFRAGTAFRESVEEYIAELGLDTFTRSAWEGVDDWPDGRGGHYDPHSVQAFVYVLANHLFGDPSLRLFGVADPGTDPPRTFAEYERWINAEDLSLATPNHVEWVHLSASDIETIVVNTQYRHRISDAWSDWEVGTSCRLDIELDPDLEGHETLVQYYSMDLEGNVEPVDTARIGYDFTPPISTVHVDGVPVATSDGEIIPLADVVVTIVASDEVSGVRAIEYILGDGAESSRQEGARLEIDMMSPCFSGSWRVRYRAVDRADNAEDWSEITVELPPISYGMERWCFERPPERVFQFPPRFQDELVDLRFFEQVAGLMADEVFFQVSGPVVSMDQSPDWKLAAFAKWDAASWVAHWDTRPLGANGLFRVRAVATVKGKPITTEPFDLLINNLENGQDYSLVATARSKTFKAGDQVLVDLRFKSGKLSSLHNPVMGLLVDRGLFKEQDEASFVRSQKLLQQGAEWNATFALTLEDDLVAEELVLAPFVRSDELRYLDGTVAVGPLTPPDATLRGRLIDGLGQGLPGMIAVSGKELSREVQTDSGGGFTLPNLPAGQYVLSVSGVANGYLPLRPYQDIEVAGRDVRADFVAVPPDGVQPTVIAELPLDVVATEGIAYGLVFDNRWGRGVETVEVAVRDEHADAWLTANGTWSRTESWFSPGQLMPLQEFIDVQLESVLSFLAEGERKAERTRLGRLAARLGDRSAPQVWVTDLGDAELESGYKAVLVRVADRAGNSSQSRLAEAVDHTLLP